MDQRLQDPAGAVPPDWRGLCEELVRELECWRPLTEVPDCLARARAALAAEADGPAVRRREPASVIGEPSDEEIMELMPQRMRDDLAAAVRAMAEQEGIDSTPAKGVLRMILNRHVVDFARAVLVRWGRPAPAPAGERQAAPVPALPEDAQVIEHSEHTILVPVPVPVAVSERPWEREGWCDDEGRCWCMSSLDGPPPRWWLVRPEPLSDGWVLPANALLTTEVDRAERGEVEP